MQALTANLDKFSLTGSSVKAFFRETRQISYKRIDRMFAVLMLLQLLFAVFIAVWLSPLTWTGTESRIHPHVWAALFLGSIISLFPVALALTRPGETSTRYVIAVGQMLMGALLIHVTGGRIETHFHVFGSLAFLAFYRDWRVLVPATTVVLLDHFLRGMFFPQSIFGVLTTSHWRWLEHSGWVVFIDVFLIISCLRGSKEMQQLAEKTIALENAEKERLLKLGEERYRELFENANDLIFTHDLEGNFTSVNKSCERITGYLREEAVTMNISQIVAPDYIEYARRMMTLMVKDQMPPVPYELVVVTKDGAKVWLEVSTRLVYENENLLGVQGIARDITERKRAEEALQNSRDYLNRIINAVGDPIFVKNRQHQLTLINDAMCQLMGRSREQLIGTVEHDLIPANEADPIWEVDELVFTSGKENINEEQFTDASNNLRTIFTKKRLHIDQDGEQFIVGTCKDITERKIFEKKIYNLAAIVESSTEAIVSKEFDGTITSWNKGAESIFGYTAAEIIGQNISILFPAERLAEETQIIEKIKRGEPIRNFETIRLRKDGSRFPISLTISPIKNNKGEIIAVSKIAHDITERIRAGEEIHKLNETLEQARDAALESTRLKSEFLANMSHEIRTPMNGIIGMTRLALDTDLDTEQREYLEMVRQSSEALLVVINDILDFSKIEARKLEIESVAFDFNKVIDDCLKPLVLRTAQKGLELTARIAPDVPDVLEGDPNRLAQILINLVGNAVKFTETGEITISVDKESETLDAVVLHFQVRDTGIGIPAEKQSTIFEAFAQADGTTTRKYGGTGLGLAITTQLVGLMGGSIWVESPAQNDSDCENPGSVFHFTVRLKPGNREMLIGAAPDSDKLIEGRPGRKTGLRILLAEDNHVNQYLAVNLLEKYRHTVKLAVNGAEAVSAFENESFDVILMDVQMPLMNGLDATRAIIEIEKSAGRTHTPIVAMTANAMKGDRERCLEAGMDDYISKPIRAEELFQIIERLAGNFIKETNNQTVDVPADDRLDLSTLLNATDGNRQLALESIRIFLADSPIKMHQIQKSIVENDGPALARATHAFMSSIGYFPSSKAIVSLKKLEDIGTNERWDAAAETYDNLSGNLEQINRFLEECINRKELGL